MWIARSLAISITMAVVASGLLSLMVSKSAGPLATVLISIAPLLTLSLGFYVGRRDKDQLGPDVLKSKDDNDAA
jgi:hypothetical protein